MPPTPLAALADVTGLPLTSGSWCGREWRDEGASPLWTPEASAHSGQLAPGETEALPAPRRGAEGQVCTCVLCTHGRILLPGPQEEQKPGPSAPSVRASQEFPP